MRHVVWSFCLVVLLGFGATVAWSQGGYTSEPARLPSLSRLPKSVTEVLDPQGTSIKDEINGIPTILCQVWWVKNLNVNKSPASSRDVLYGDLENGSLIGLLHFPSEGEDVRDQKLRAGYYLMRYARLPQSPDTEEVSHYRDFVLVTPVDADQQIERNLSMDELLKLSRLASHTSLPAIFSLMPVNPAYKTYPLVLTDGVGNCIMQVNLAATAGGGAVDHVKLAVLLLTPPKEDGGS